MFFSTVPHFARPIIEAQTMGTPVIGLRIDGVTEVVEGSHTLQLVAGANASVLAQVLEIVLAQDEDHFQDQENNHMCARSRYNSRSQLPNIESPYVTQ